MGDRIEKIRIQDYSEIFWKLTMAIWLPLVIFYQLFKKNDKEK